MQDLIGSRYSIFRDSTDFKKILVLLFSYRKLFSLKLFLKIFFKIYNITLYPDPNWTKILDQDPNLMHLDFGSTTLLS